MVEQEFPEVKAILYSVEPEIKKRPILYGIIAYWPRSEGCGWWGVPASYRSWSDDRQWVIRRARELQERGWKRVTLIEIPGDIFYDGKDD